MHDPARLITEIAIFGIASAALADAERPRLAIALAAAVAARLILTFPRTARPDASVGRRPSARRRVTGLRIARRRPTRTATRIGVMLSTAPSFETQEEALASVRATTRSASSRSEQRRLVLIRVERRRLIHPVRAAQSVSRALGNALELGQGCGSPRPRYVLRR
jgi:hypothetical protein